MLLVHKFFQIFRLLIEEKLLVLISRLLIEEKLLVLISRLLIEEKLLVHKVIYCINLEM